MSASYVSPYDELLAQTVARHFRGARLDGARVEVGVRDLCIDCRVDEVEDVNGMTSVALAFELSSHVLGDHPVGTTMNGHGQTARAAILSGGCHWACAFGPVLRAGFENDGTSEVDRLECRVHSQRFRVFVDSIDRAVLHDGAPRGDSPEARMRAARRRLGGKPWITPFVLASYDFPALPRDRCSIVSTFYSDGDSGRVVEIEVDGYDCDLTTFDDAPREPPGGRSLLHELAILVPMAAHVG